MRWKYVRQKAQTFKILFDILFLIFIATIQGREELGYDRKRKYFSQIPVSVDKNWIWVKKIQFKTGINRNLKLVYSI